MNRIIAGLIITLLPCAALAQKASTSTDQVPIEEYVPKVIIEGKWGTGPGEFGALDDPMQAEYYKVPQFPGSLAVNSKNEIYILDHINGRIQKFSRTGKHLADIPVLSCADDNKNNIVKVEAMEEGVTSFDLSSSPSFIGVNIVIDSKDNLYYYLKRVKDGKESGEVWQFRNDKLVKKYSSLEKGGLPSKFKMISVASNQYELSVTDSQDITRKQGYRVKINRNEDFPSIEIEHPSTSTFKIAIAPPAAYSTAKAKNGRAKFEVYFEKILENGNFRVRIVSGALKAIETEEREYTATGKLVRRIKSPPGYSHGLEVGETGVKVVKWIIEKAK